MSKYVRFEQLRAQAESLVQQQDTTRTNVDEDEVTRELRVREKELTLQREAIEQTENRLEELIAERTAELEAANRSLKAENEVRATIETRLRRNRERLRSLASQLEDVEERERRRIALNLHDLIGQTLVSAGMKLGLLARSASDENQRAELEEIRRLNHRMLEETRNIITELSPPVLEEQDMRTASRWLIDHFGENHGLDITFEDHLDEQDLPYPVRRFLFRILRELLFNVVKHARTSIVTVRLKATRTRAELSVSDAGIGFDPNDLEDEEGFGLFSLRERVTALGGTVDIESVRGEGTRVTVVLRSKAHRATGRTGFGPTLLLH
jgi:signal transduction histidine kinase